MAQVAHRLLLSLAHERSIMPAVKMYGSVGSLHTLDDAEVALCAGSQCLKRLLVTLAFVSCQRDLIAVELDKYRPQLQPGFVSADLARGTGQQTCPE